MNSLYRTYRGRQILSKKGRLYREAALAELLTQDRRKFRGRIDIEIRLKMPDKRRRDIDNTLKAIFDIMTHAHIWDDDEQVDRLLVIRDGFAPGGLALLVIKEIGD